MRGTPKKPRRGEREKEPKGVGARRKWGHREKEFEGSHASKMRNAEIRPSGRIERGDYQLNDLGGAVLDRWGGAQSAHRRQNNRRGERNSTRKKKLLFEGVAPGGHAKKKGGWFSF